MLPLIPDYFYEEFNGGLSFKDTTNILTFTEQVTVSFSYVGYESVGNIPYRIVEDKISRTFRVDSKWQLWTVTFTKSEGKPFGLYFVDMDYPANSSVDGGLEGVVYVFYLVDDIPFGSYHTVYSPDDAFSFLYEFGEMILTSPISTLWNVQVFGVPFWTLLIGSGFLVYAGWSILKWISPL